MKNNLRCHIYFQVTHPQFKTIKRFKNIDKKCYIFQIHFLICSAVSASVEQSES